MLYLCTVMRRICLLLFCVFSVLSAAAYDICLEGYIGGKYPIVMWLEVSDGGVVLSGKYAYKSTLKKKGMSSPNNYLYLRSERGNLTHFTAWEYNGYAAESWYNVCYSEYHNTYTISGRMRAKSGKVFSFAVSCDVLDISPRAQDFFMSLAGY